MVGSKEIFVTDSVDQKSLTFTQPELASVIFILYQRPPLAPPAQTLLAVVGSQANALVRPPTLLGPNSVQLVAALELSPGNVVALAP